MIVSTINRAIAQFIGSTTLGLALANLGVSFIKDERKRNATQL